LNKTTVRSSTLEKPAREKRASTITAHLRWHNCLLGVRQAKKLMPLVTV
jgi:hypothetical protein